jgi:hypothetical protein
VEKEAAGENVGILCFSAATAHAIVAKAGELIELGGETGWLGAAVRLVAKERDIRAVDIAGLPWGEIDSAYDLDHVRKTVLPAIHRRRTSARPLRRLAMRALIFALFGSAALGLYGISMPEPPLSWDTVAIPSLPEVNVLLREQPQRWWALEAGRKIEIDLEGAGPVRIETRLVLGDKEEEAANVAGEPYVLWVAADGQLVDAFKREGKLDPEASHPTWALAKRKRIQLDFTGHRRTLAVRFTGAREPSVCLLRLRTLDPDSDADQEE